MKTETLRKILIFWTLFIGLGALLGAFMMFYDTTGNAFGMAAMLPLFQVLPFSDILFQNFLIPGIALLLINGFTNFFTFYLLIKQNKYAGIAGICCGILLMLWICVQFYIFPFNFMSTIYFVFGFLEALTGYLLYRKEKQIA